MCAVAAIYGLSVNEVVKLSEPQIQYMLDQAGKAADSLIQENSTYKRAVTGHVLATRRAVTSATGSEFSDLHMRLGACSAEFATAKLFFTSPTFGGDLRSKLGPVTRGVRAMLEQDPEDGYGGGGGGGLGPPPGM